MNDSPIIIALDVPSAAEARRLVNAIGDAASFYKVGLELYAAAGPDFARELKSEGYRVFLDLKLHDIGETVRRAVAAATEIAPDFLTIHATDQVMRAAVAGRDTSNVEGRDTSNVEGRDTSDVEGRGESALKLLAVGVLTSLDDSDLLKDGYATGVTDLVELRARNAMDAGVDGIVCSPREVARVRGITGRKMILLNPGVRSAGSAAGDQKRVATPAEAIAAGADYVVIGRQVTRAKDPRGETLRVLEEIGAVAKAG
jgi:orotidine-5'-phosphate decarboxylase